MSQLTSEWNCRAAEAIGLHAPLLNADQSMQLAKELRQAWPNLLPEEAVRLFFSPVDCCEAAAIVELV